MFMNSPLYFSDLDKVGREELNAFVNQQKKIIGIEPRTASLPGLTLTSSKTRGKWIPFTKKKEMTFNFGCIRYQKLLKDISYFVERKTNEIAAQGAVLSRVQNGI